jgi:hypothetical protein
MSDTAGAPRAVRFQPGVMAMARHLAQRDGMSLSAWVRRVVEREVARREGNCGSCGQAVPRERREVTGRG